jgi:hypothetical protein
MNMFHITKEKDMKAQSNDGGKVRIRGECLSCACYHVPGKFAGLALKALSR